MINKREYGELLSKAIKLAAAEKGLKISVIHRLLAETLNYSEEIIEYWRKGNIPPHLEQLKMLLTKLIELGGIRNISELQSFIACTDYNEENFFDLVKDLGEKENFYNGSYGFVSEHPYRIIKRHCQRVLSWDGFSTTETEIEIEALYDYPLDGYVSRGTRYGKEYDDLHISIDTLYREKNGIVSYELLSQTPTSYTRRIIFSPPLRKFEKAGFKITKISNFQSLTFEELEKLVATRRAFAHYCIWSLNITVPTEELILRLNFPAGYKIQLPQSGGFSVKFGGIDDANEKMRLIQSRSFMLRDLENYSLQLHVIKPATGRKYQLEWIPPSQNALKNNVFFK